MASLKNDRIPLSMEHEWLPEQEFTQTLEEQAEAIGAEAKSFFGFQAPLWIEVQPSPNNEWGAGVHERPENPYEGGERSIHVILRDPTDPEKQRDFRSFLPFVMRHELGHVVPVPHGLDYLLFAGRDSVRAMGLLKGIWLTRARREALADVFAFRASLEGGDSIQPDVLNGYLRLIDRFDRQHGGEETPYRDILRGQAVLETLAQRDYFSTAQLQWLTMWQTRANEFIRRRFNPEQMRLYEIGLQYCRRTAAAAWTMDLRPRKAEDLDKQQPRDSEED